MSKLWYLLFIVCYIAILVFNIQTLSISLYEIELLSDTHLVGFWVRLLDYTSFDIKYSFLLLHLLNLVLMYIFSLKLLQNQRQALYSVFIFALIPGISLLGVIVSISSLVLFVTLLFFIFWLYEQKLLAYLMLIVSLFVDESFFYFYFGLFFFALKEKNYFLIYLMIALIMSSIGIYDIDIGGRPRGYFLESFSLFLAIFSPFVFLYFVYTLYVKALVRAKTIVWYVSFTVFIVALVLSFRPKIYIDDFGIFMLIFTPVMVGLFFQSFHSHIKELRFKYKIIVSTILASLLASFLFTFLNIFLFVILSEPSSHFAYRYYGAKELAYELKQQGIYSVQTEPKLAKKLEFYGVNSGSGVLVKFWGSNIRYVAPKGNKLIKVKYFGKTIKTYYVILPKVKI